MGVAEPLKDGGTGGRKNVRRDSVKENTFLVGRMRASLVGWNNAVDQGGPPCTGGHPSNRVTSLALPPILCKCPSNAFDSRQVNMVH